MSKGNMLLGQARGKMGSMVFFVRDGVQQQRPYVEKQKNPRTTPQMLQRVKLASVVGFYKRQASFFRFALKKKKNESYYNAFVRYNLNFAPYLTKEEAALGFQIPAPYIISDGDMPQIGVSYVGVAPGNIMDFRTSISTSIVTWGDMRRAYGLLMGDMISIVIFNRSTLSTDQTKRVVVQHVFDQVSENLPIGYDMVGTTWDSDGEVWSIQISASYFGIDSWYAVGVGIVTSRNANGVDCSYCQLKLSEMGESLYLNYHSDEQHQEAAASYGSTQDAILDPNSFEGNYIDMVQLYEDAAHNTPVRDLVMYNTSTKTLYADLRKVPGVADYDISVIGGGESVVAGSVNISAGTVTLTGNEEAKGKNTIEIQWLDVHDNIIATSVLNVTVNAAS